MTSLLCRLGNDRYKTKIIYENLNPKWYEQFDLSLLEDHSQELEVTVWDKDQRSKDDFMGRCSVDLSKLEHEITHKLWVDLEEGEGKLFILLTIHFDCPSASPQPRTGGGTQEGNDKFGSDVWALEELARLQ